VHLLGQCDAVGRGQADRRGGAPVDAHDQRRAGQPGQHRRGQRPQPLDNMWKPTQQEALWFHGGNLHQSRHYSLYLALRLKARQEGIPTPVYRLKEVHHLS
jgi:putative flavoprotein involved in K+ transport